MDRKLIIAAALSGALTLSAAPAMAEHGIGIGIPDAKTSHYVGAPTSPDLGNCGNRQGGHGGFSRCSGEGWAYADGSWAIANNRSWDSGSYNDWWHDRPDRAYPRWVQEQRMRGWCEPDRMWWSGSGWHC